MDVGTGTTWPLIQGERQPVNCSSPLLLLPLAPAQLTHHIHTHGHKYTCTHCQVHTHHMYTCTHTHELTGTEVRFIPG